MWQRHPHDLGCLRDGSGEERWEDGFCGRGGPRLRGGCRRGCEMERRRTGLVLGMWVAEEGPIPGKGAEWWGLSVLLGG